MKETNWNDCLINKSAKTITPDIIIEPSFTDFENGNDPVFEWILKQ